MQSKSRSQRPIGIAVYLERGCFFSYNPGGKLYPARRLPFSAACQGQHGLYTSRLLSSRGSRRA